MVVNCFNLLNRIIIVSVVLIITLLGCTSNNKIENQPNTIDVTTPAVATKKFTYTDDITVDFLMGKFDPSLDTTFTTIASHYSDRIGLLMKKEAYAAFIKMYDAALNDGVKLVIRSAARNFDYQKSIWEKKWTGKTILSNGENAQSVYPKHVDRARKILEYSSMPGTSRHHWGTDIDFNSFNNSWFEQGEGLKVFTWLEQNAADYGYCRPYTMKGDNRPHGYNEEKWHWTYKPLSDVYTSYALENMKSSMISGFLGSDAAVELDVVSHYVLGINNDCK
jgi:LAS superfamily LD-carboxypeptidase LdcB